MRQSWETMTSVSAGHVILTPTQPVGSGQPQRESNPGPAHQESRALPTELLRPLAGGRSCEVCGDMGKNQYQKGVVNRISITATASIDTIHKNNQTLLLRRNQIPPLRFPRFRMMSSCSPVCISYAHLRKVICMPSLLI